MFENYNRMWEKSCLTHSKKTLPLWPYLFKLLFCLHSSAFLYYSSPWSLSLYIHLISSFPVILSLYFPLRTMVLEKTSESPLDSKEIKSVTLKGNQPWILIGRTDAEAEAPVFWSSDVKSLLSRKVPNAGKDWRQREEGIRRWDGWVASPMQWTWTWANFGRWWGTRRPGVL